MDWITIGIMVYTNLATDESFGSLTLLVTFIIISGIYSISLWRTKRKYS